VTSFFHLPKRLPKRNHLMVTLRELTMQPSKLFHELSIIFALYKNLRTNQCVLSIKLFVFVMQIHFFLSCVLLFLFDKCASFSAYKSSTMDLRYQTTCLGGLILNNKIDKIICKSCSFFSCGVFIKFHAICY